MFVLHSLWIFIATQKRAGNQREATGASWRAEWEHLDLAPIGRVRHTVVGSAAAQREPEQSTGRHCLLEGGRGDRCWWYEFCGRSMGNLDWENILTSFSPGVLVERFFLGGCFLGWGYVFEDRQSWGPLVRWFFEGNQFALGSPNLLFTIRSTLSLHVDY